MKEKTKNQKWIEYQGKAKEGDKVIVRWTNCGYYYETKGKIVRCNNKSFSVEILEDYDGYKKGKKLNIPNCFNPLFSINNTILPLDIHEKNKKVELDKIVRKILK